MNIKAFLAFSLKKHAVECNPYTNLFVPQSSNWMIDESLNLRQTQYTKIILMQGLSCLQMWKYIQAQTYVCTDCNKIKPSGLIQTAFLRMPTFLQEYCLKNVCKNQQPNKFFCFDTLSKHFIWWGHAHPLPSLWCHKVVETSAPYVQMLQPPAEQKIINSDVIFWWSLSVQ